MSANTHTDATVDANANANADTDAMADANANSNANRRRDAFITAMGRLTSTVTVVTTAGPAGKFGMTVSAMCSVAADPPRLLVCINQGSPAYEAVSRNGVFGVNVLMPEHVALARSFAGLPSEVAAPFEFTEAGWQRGATGSPLLREALAWFDCRRHHEHDEATHRIFIGEVVEAFSRDGAPLLYGARSFQSGKPL